MEFTRWLPCYASTDIKIPGAPAGQGFFLTNGVVGTDMLEDEVLFDVNINDVGIREDIEIMLRGEKQVVKHSLYFFQFVIGRVTDEEAPKPVSHTFRPPSGRIVTPNGPGPLPGLPGGGPLG